MKLVFRSFASLILLFVFSSEPLLAYDLPAEKRPDLKKEPLEILEKISDGVSIIADHAKRGVVFVSVSKVVRGMPMGANPFEFFFGPGFEGGGPQGRQREFKQEGLGSGYLVDLDRGYIITNNHVIEGADEIHVKLSNGGSYEATVVGRDKNTDVAVVQIKDKKFNRDDLVQLSLANSDKAKVGSIAIALGAPYGLESSISLGVISAIGRGSLSITALGDFIQTDAAINPGNSGGPLLDASGQVIGMNTAIFSRSGGYAGIGFAIPANLVRNIAGQLLNKGKIERGYLGVAPVDLDSEFAKALRLPPKVNGALLRSVEPGGPAAKAKLRDGDVVVEISAKKDGSTHKIDSAQTLRNVVGLRKPGEELSVVYYRDGKKQNANVVIGDFAKVEGAQQEDEGTAEAAFGLVLAPVGPESRQRFRYQSKQGAVVIEVEEGSPAERSGIEPGDVIIKVNDRTVRRPSDFLSYAKGKNRLLLRMERRGQTLIIPFRT